MAIIYIERADKHRALRTRNHEAVHHGPIGPCSPSHALSCLAFHHLPFRVIPATCVKFTRKATTLQLRFLADKKEITTRSRKVLEFVSSIFIKAAPTIQCIN